MSPLSADNTESLSSYVCTPLNLPPGWTVIDLVR